MLTYVLWLYYISKVSSNRTNDSNTVYTGNHQAAGFTDLETAWVTIPNIRGTWDLLLSCFLTLFLCAWTAYHPNIPQDNSRWAIPSRRLFWVIIAIFAPEIVVVIAVTQFSTALKLRNAVNAIGKAQPTRHQTEDVLSSPSAWPSMIRDTLFNQRTKPEMILSRHQETDKANHAEAGELKINSENDIKIEVASTEWNMTQAFFAASGGLAVRSETFFPTEQLVFTPDGVVELARLGLLPTIPTDVIVDKSKADAFAKLLVCLQAGWFLLQSLGRLVQGLPLTLLEIHTIIHVCWAFFLYSVWMKKPYDVQRPIHLSDDDIINVAALYASSPSCIIDLSSLIQSDKMTARNPNEDHLVERNSDSGYITTEQIETAQRFPVGDLLLLHHWRKVWPVSFKKKWTLESLPLEKDSPKVKEHHARANKAIERMRTIGYNFHWFECKTPSGIRGTPQDDINNAVDFDRCYIARVVTNIPAAGHLANNPMLKFGVIGTSLLLLCAMYGGAHLGAWYTHFPTDVEKWMWRSAGMCLVTAPMVMLVSGGWTEIGLWLKSWPDYKSGRRSHLWRLLYTLWVVPFWPILLLGYILPTLCLPSRLFILIEALLSLRSPADGTYVTEKWSGYIPHAS